MNKNYWENRYLHGNTPWTLNCVAPPIKHYFETVNPPKHLKILIPGVGSSKEALYLYELGYKNVFVLDISEHAIVEFESKYPEFPKGNVILGNYFDHTNHYDLVVEQTFFCALPLSIRKQYASHTNQILVVGGKLLGLFFQGESTDEGPPFRASKLEYEELFQEYFKISKLERCYNSIPPRQGSELFFIFEKTFI
jgi:thiopurine S-methyltransferase